MCIRDSYSDLLYEGQHISPASLPGMAERTATINSLSKSHAVSGWRVGWVIGPKTMADHLEHLSLCMLFGIPEFIQNAAQLALDENLPEVALMREEYRQRRDLVCTSLNQCPGIRAIRPDGGMFVMADVRETGLTAQHFAERLLKGYGVSVLAGEAMARCAVDNLLAALAGERPPNLVNGVAWKG